jgi:hypothetical protein
MSDDFQIVAVLAEKLSGAVAWKRFGQRERADAIHEQLRMVDAEQKAPRPAP